MNQKKNCKPCFETIGVRIGSLASLGANVHGGEAFHLPVQTGKKKTGSTMKRRN